MHTPEWIGLIVGLPPWITAAIVIVNRGTRLVVAVENLVKSFENLNKTVTDHETRLRRGGL